MAPGTARILMSRLHAELARRRAELVRENGDAFGEVTLHILRETPSIDSPQF